MFSLTAGENIAIGQVDDLHNQAAVEEAARLGGAADLIGALPEGYDTLIGRAFAGGVALSGGNCSGWPWPGPCGAGETS